jgi:tetratricopeptide (TPR) repeat protein
MVKNVRNLHDRAASPYFYPAPPAILNYLEGATTSGAPATVLADADLSVTLPAYIARANIIAHRAPTTSEVFPADQQDEALQRLIDQDAFYRTHYLTTESLAILDRYDVQYIVTSSGSGIDAQLQLSADWFEWILNDQSYSLYRVKEIPEVSASIEANTAMAARNWTQAEEYFREALAADPQDPLALLGMAEIAHARGQFAEALDWLHQAQAVVELPIVDYQQGLILVESGDLEAGIAALENAQTQAPRVSRYHVALGDACLNAGRLDCAGVQYAAAAQYETLPDAAARNIAQADLWRQQGRPDMALPYYEAAVAQQPSEYNLFLLESAYREAGRFDLSANILAELRDRHPYSPEVLLAQATAQAAQDNIDQAVAHFDQAIALQKVLAQETVDSYLALAQVLLSANRLEDARTAIEAAIARRPYHPVAYRLQGELYDRQEQYEQAINAYERAYQLDPTQIDTFIALSNMLQVHGGRQEGIVSLLQETIEANPDEAILFLALGDQLQSNGDPAGAVEAFNNALDRLDAYFLSDNLRPRRSSAEGRAFIYARMARAYENLQESQTAINYYRAAVAAAPDAPWTHVLLGDAYRRGNDLGAAETAYLRALDSDAAYADAYIGLAELYMDSQRYEEADEFLLLALADNDQNLDPYMRLADLEQRRGNDQAALIWLRDAAKVSTANRNVNIPLVDSLVRYGDYGTAHRYLEDALVLRPTDADLMLRLGQLQRTMGQYALAEATLLKARRLNRDDSRVYAELGALYKALARPESAQQVYMQAIALQPGVANHPVALSQLWRSRGNFDQAQAVLKAALPTATPVEDIYIALSTLYAQQGELDLAGETLQQGLAQVGESSPLLLALGRHYLSLADYTQAQEQYKRVIELNLDAAAAYAALGDLYIRRSDGEAAVTQFEAALAVEPDNATYHLGLAEALALAGRPDEALIEYEEALTVLPTLETIYLSLANFYSAIEQPADAWTTYQQAMEKAPTSGRVLRQYALFLAGQEQESQALTVLNRAVELDPSAAVYIARANLQAALEDYPAAMADLETARSLEPGSVDALIALGDLFRDQENFAEAEKAYASVVSLAPNLPVGYLRLGNLAGLQGDLDTAQEYADAAREVAPGILNPPDDVAQ